MGGYSDGRYNTRQQIRIADQYAMTSVQASATTIQQHEFMQNVTVTDWNISVHNGATCTGATSFRLTLNRIPAGTGAAAAIGTATVAGTSANTTVVDGSVVGGTACFFSAGDHIRVSTVAGTALPADSVNVSVWVEYEEHFV